KHDRIRRVSMDHRIDVGAGAQHLAVDGIFSVPPVIALQLLAVETERDAVFERDFLEAEAGRLHVEFFRIARTAQRNMPARPVPLPGLLEDSPRLDHLLLEVFVHAFPPRPARFSPYRDALALAHGCLTMQEKCQVDVRNSAPSGPGRMEA